MEQTLGNPHRRPNYFQRKLGMEVWSDDQRKNLGLEFLMKEYISVSGSFDGFPLPKPTTNFLADQESAVNRLIYDEAHYDIQRIDAFLSGSNMMNTNQTAAFQAIDEALRCADNQHPAEPCRCPTLFFLDGPGGTGKTFLRIFC